MLTPFGIFVRKLRIDKDVNMKMMASSMNLSTAYISSVELGRSPLSDKYVERVADYFNIDRQSRTHDSLLLSVMETRGFIKIPVGSTRLHHEVIIAFKNNFDKLSDDQLDELMTILEK